MRIKSMYRLLLGFMLMTFGGIFSQSAWAGLCLNATDLATDRNDALQVGTNIIAAIFNTINTIMTNISQTFYTGIVGNSDFQNIVGTLTVLYLCIYGIMIFFGLAQATGREVVMRLIKIGIVWSLLSSTNGWTFFNTYIGNLFLGGMNELITQFSLNGVTGVTSVSLNGAACSSGSGPLCAAALQNIYVPLGLVVGQKFIVSVFSLASICPYGVIMSMFLVLALVEFILMMVAVILTYIKSIVGLCFLFGIAPIFIITLFFGKTKQIFFGWLNQVISFALTPVMLFAFLSFYIQLILAAIQNMLYNDPGSLDYCWTKWISAGEFNVEWWRPKTTNGPTDGDWGCITNPPPIGITDILYFAILCYLGKSFGKAVEGLAMNISGGVGPGAEQAFSAMDAIKDRAVQGFASMTSRGNVEKSKQGATPVGSRPGGKGGGSR